MTDPDCRAGAASGMALRDSVSGGPGMAGGAEIGPSAVAIGRMVKYRALGGGFHDAEILAVRPDGRIDIESVIPPHSRVFLSRIVVARDQASCGRGEAFIP